MDSDHWFGMSFPSWLYSTLRSGLKGARTITSDDTQVAYWEERGGRWLFPPLSMSGEEDEMRICSTVSKEGDQSNIRGGSF